MEIQKLIGHLRGVKHFQRLPLSAIREIVLSGSVKHYKEEQVIFREGSPCSGLYVLLKGKVYLYKCGLQGQEAIIATIVPTTMFNEVAALDGECNPTINV